MPDIYWIPLLVALGAFALLWPLSVRLRDASIVDYVWAPGFLAQLGIAVFLLDGVGTRAWMLLALIAPWSLRLTFTLARRRLREGHEDPRYTSMRNSWGLSFWWKSYFIVFTLQPGLQWVIVSGAIAGAASAGQTLGLLAWVGAAIAIAGFAIESVADAQLDRFKRQNEPGALMTWGLRKYVRHPNYAGEILFWCGIALIGLQGGAWWALISPIVIGFFLVTVSGVPMLDERLSATRDDWQDYRAKTPAFLPWVRGAGVRRTRPSKTPNGQ